MTAEEYLNRLSDAVASIDEVLLATTNAEEVMKLTGLGVIHHFSSTIAVLQTVRSKIMAQRDWWMAQAGPMPQLVR